MALKNPPEDAPEIHLTPKGSEKLKQALRDAHTVNGDLLTANTALLEELDQVKAECFQLREVLTEAGVDLPENLKVPGEAPGEDADPPETEDPKKGAKKKK